MSHFFFMGCWNNDNCLTDGGDAMDYRLAVIQHIGKHHKTHPFSFGVVAGDNVYPHKPITGAPKKIKYYYQKTLRYGNDALHAELKGVPLYYALGNHDVVKQDVIDYHLKHWMKDGTQYAKWISPHLAIVVVDTNLLQKNITETIQKYYGIQTPQEGFAVLQRFLNSVRLESQKRGFQGFTVIVGHEPLLTVKQREETLKVDALVSYEAFLAEMTRFPHPIYLCADVHAFQVWNMNAVVDAKPTTLPMVVVGTGGASPDVNPTNPVIHLKGDGIDIKPKLLASQPSYGFADIEATEHRLRLRFHPLKYCSAGQYEAVYEWVKHGSGNRRMAKASVSPRASGSSGKKYPLDLEKCIKESGVKPTVPVLCDVASTDKPMDGGGRYNRVMNTVLVAEYVVYQGRRHRIHRDSADGRRKYIQTRSGRVYAPDYRS